MHVVAVDWSGAARGAARHIWLAHVVDGVLVTLRNGRSRGEVVADLASLRARAPLGLAVGLDFSFSFPAWFLQERRCTTIDDLWSMTRSEGEEWLARCDPPFWGRVGQSKPNLQEHFRRAERCISVGGIRPKSVFQIGGAGAVGTGTIRGIPWLPVLREAGFSIWPFDEASRWTVFEIYPRLLTGPVRKSSAPHRASYLRAAPWSLTRSVAEAMCGSEDAFDAGVSALVLHEHLADLRDLTQTRDPIVALEGDVWRPPKINP